MGSNIILLLLASYLMMVSTLVTDTPPNGVPELTYYSSTEKTNVIQNENVEVVNKSSSEILVIESETEKKTDQTMKKKIYVMDENQTVYATGGYHNQTLFDGSSNLCPSGRRFNNETGRCIDIDECAERPDICPQGLDCINLNILGGYDCVVPGGCAFGFKLEGDKCVRIECNKGWIFNYQADQCVDLNECTWYRVNCSYHCVNEVGTYKCICPSDTAWRIGNDNLTCIDVNECELNTDDCTDLEVCINTEGGFKCHPKNDTSTSKNGACDDGELLDDNGNCVNVNECQTEANQCEYRCRDRWPGFECLCPEGLRLKEDKKTCEDIDECENPISCINGECINTNASYECNCFDGYKKSPYKQNLCLDIDECVDNKTICSYRCFNTEPGYHCQCKPRGYKLLPDNKTCVDIDECATSKTGKKDCDQLCINTEGSYKCACNEGFKLRDDGANCMDINECDEEKDICSANGYCNNIEGSYRCTCKKGYELSTNEKNKTTCVDIDECAENIAECQKPQVCLNRDGDYECGCPIGYKLSDDGGSCDDIDECALGVSKCSSVCINTIGGYRCVCKSGYELNATDNHTCIDVDECLSSPCVQRCVNLPGEYRCECNDGYRMEGDTCADVDECRENLSRCSTLSTCQNTIGSYRCECKKGFQMSPDNFTCLDIDECQASNECSHGCLNTFGSYICRCPYGFKLSFDQKNCVDEDECISGLSKCDNLTEICENLEGGYKCQPKCTLGYRATSLHNNICEDIDECELKQRCKDDAKCVNTDGSFSCIITIEKKVVEIVKQIDDSTESRKCNTSTTGEGAAIGTTTSPEVSTTSEIIYDNGTDSGSHKKCPKGERPKEDGDSCEPIVCSTGYDLRDDDTCQLLRCPDGYDLSVDQCTIHQCSFGQVLDSRGHCVPLECPHQYKPTCSHQCLPVETCREGWIADEKGHCVTHKQCPTGSIINGQGRCIKQIVCPLGYLTLSNGECKKPVKCQFGLVNDPTTGECVEFKVCPRGKKLTRDGRCTTMATCPLGMKPGFTGVCETVHCYPGYQYDMTIGMCVDVDECASDKFECFDHEMCVNTIGGHNCTYCVTLDTGGRYCQSRRMCVAGFRPTKWTPRHCDDIDECALGEHNCTSSQICKNTFGSFICEKCPPGFEIDLNGKCIDVDECKIYRTLCDMCVNKIGSFQCICESGFEFDKRQRRCVDVNECSSDPGICGDEGCWNLVGGYRCGCPEGYEPNLTRECVDVDECLGTPCLGDEACVNKVGGFECVEVKCPFDRKPKNGKCQLEIECDPDTGNCTMNSELKKPCQIESMVIPEKMNMPSQRIQKFVGKSERKNISFEDEKLLKQISRIVKVTTRRGIEPICENCIVAERTKRSNEKSFVIRSPFTNDQLELKVTINRQGKN